MVVGVVAHDVAFGGHAADDVRCGLDHVAHHEEGGGDIVLFQRVQNLLRVAVLIAAVEGQVDDLLGCVPQVISIVFCQVHRCCVADGGGTFRLEGQTPVCGGGRNGGGSGGRLCGLSLKVQHPGQKQAGGQQHYKSAEAAGKDIHGIPPVAYHCATVCPTVAILCSR